MSAASSAGRSRAGFTLVEVLMGTLLLLMLMATMLATSRVHIFALKRQETQLDVQETARSVLDLMAREIRQAGYDPLCAKSFPGVTDGRPQLLEVQFDHNANGILDADEVVTYAYDPTAAQLTRASAGVAVVLATGTGATSLSFKYYDGTGTRLSPAGTPAALTAAQRKAVRRVRIALRIEGRGPDPANPLPIVSEVVSNVDLRNRFLNGSVQCP